MIRTTVSTAAGAALLLAAVAAPLAAQQPAQPQWPVHDQTRPAPPVVTPGVPVPVTRPPSDAVVLFDGTSLDAWQTARGEAPRWRIGDGYVEVVARTGAIQTRQAFGDVQLHIEWATPATSTGTGQGFGNSGVFFMGRYEVQVLNSHQNPTYPDGQAASLYGQFPPLVNASRPPGEWQTYDIVFRAPRFREDGSLLRPARVTVFHNGVLVQDNQELTGPTAHQARPPYGRHADRLPLSLQDHGDPVRFRNIWIRELAPEP
jgi:hypothetical protein